MVVLINTLLSPPKLTYIQLFSNESPLHEFLKCRSIVLLYPKHLLQNHTHLLLQFTATLLPKVEIYFPQHFIYSHSHWVHVIFESICQRFFYETFWVVVEFSQHGRAIVRTSYKSIGASSSIAAKPEICDFELESWAKDDNVSRFDVRMY